MLFSLIISVLWVIGCLVFFYFKDNSDKLTISTQEGNHSAIKSAVPVTTVVATDISVTGKETNTSNSENDKVVHKRVKHQQGITLGKQENKSVFIDFNNPNLF